MVLKELHNVLGKALQLVEERVVEDKPWADKVVELADTQAWAGKAVVEDMVPLLETWALVGKVDKLACLAQSQ
jgi:hypothetical protein